MNSTILIAIIMIAALALIIWILSIINNRNKKQAEEKQLQLFSGKANELQLKVFKTHRMKDRILGWDEQINNILFIDFKHQPHTTNFIQAKEISHCKLITTTANEHADGNSDITAIILELSCKSIASPKHCLTFYEYGRDSLFDMMLLKQKAEHWKDLLNGKKQ